MMYVEEEPLSGSVEWPWTNENRLSFMDSLVVLSLLVSRFSFQQGRWRGLDTVDSGRDKMMGRCDRGKLRLWGKRWPSCQNSISVEIAKPSQSCSVIATAIILIPSGMLLFSFGSVYFVISSRVSPPLRLLAVTPSQTQQRAFRLSWDSLISWFLLWNAAHSVCYF